MNRGSLYSIWRESNLSRSPTNIYKALLLVDNTIALTSMRIPEIEVSHGVEGCRMPGSSYVSAP